MKRAVIAGIFVAVVLSPIMAPGGRPASAQSLNFSSGGSDVPIEIFAENGIEWQQEELIFLARGNARAVRGEVEVRADLLRAYYRRSETGATVITRLDAEGNVKIITPGEKAYGNKGIYDIENAVLVLSGGKVRYVTANDEITADNQIEYWEKKQMAVARGNAVATHEGKRLRADVMAAYFRNNEKGKSSVYRVEAFDNVRIDTDKDQAASDRAVYNVESGIATLTGSVKIIREQNELNGCSAEVNLNTGISKLFSCPSAVQGGERVRGFLKPNSGKKK
ncbi:MAG: hypothetical protein A3G18_06130 [Rhodospirillales bacterium RIFCSPLOWO2_12_FULL_58_28]|nr:MAG: hypothetical protein A3H92_03970 [Rhodospirillales bacterium RIFCSPLOWO2_02_FULL_58_16]OHC79990.1 MAG: hypothetical protein A3G18_06130 [Rhodospirillales bacterium RIFCSPLOWO2_12_FULL_58_28]